MVQWVKNLTVVASVSAEVWVQSPAQRSGVRRSSVAAAVAQIQYLAHTTATATRDLNRVCDLHQSS